MSPKASAQSSNNCNYFLIFKILTNNDLFTFSDGLLGLPGRDQRCYSLLMRIRKKNRSISWEIRGSRWTYSLEAEASADPMELATTVLEEMFGVAMKLGTGSGMLTNEDEDEVEFGIFVVVVNENTIDPEDHILIPTTTILANAGYHEECAKLEKMVSDLSAVDFLHTLLSQTGMRTE